MRAAGGSGAAGATTDMPLDGWEWRKYGQKTTLGQKYPRYAHALPHRASVFEAINFANHVRPLSHVKAVPVVHCVAIRMPMIPLPACVGLSRGIAAYTFVKR